MANYVTRLKIGDKAPNFKGVDQDGIVHSLDNKRTDKLVLYFYPKDDTPSCTVQACNLRDNFSLLRKRGYTVLGVSADNEKKHSKFISKYKLPFPLIADIDKTIINLYDVWGEKKFMGITFDGIIRTTFVIDQKGIIENIITNVKTKNHTNQVLENL